MPSASNRLEQLLMPVHVSVTVPYHNAIESWPQKMPFPDESGKLVEFIPLVPYGQAVYRRLPMRIMPCLLAFQLFLL